MRKLKSAFDKLSPSKILQSKPAQKVAKAFDRHPQRFYVAGLITITLFVFWTRLGNLAVFTLVALIYPFNQTMKAIANQYYGEVTKWSVYWMVFALFYLIQYLVHLFFDWRNYNLLVVSLILYLVYCPHMNLTELAFDNIEGVIIKKFFPTETSIEGVILSLRRNDKEGKTEVTKVESGKGDTGKPEPNLNLNLNPLPDLPRKESDNSVKSPSQTQSPMPPSKMSDTLQPTDDPLPIVTSSSPKKVTDQHSTQLPYNSNAFNLRL